MATNFDLTRLPPELRNNVWRFALLEESRKRLIPYSDYTRTISPTPQLVSPLLNVNNESRRATQAFYTFQINVETHRPVQGCSRPQPAARRQKGVLYLNLERDTLLQGFDTITRPKPLRWPFYNDEELEERKKYPYSVVMRHGTRPLTNDECRQVKRMFEIDTEPDDDLKFDDEEECCWGCYYKTWYGMDQDDAVVFTNCTKERYPNIWLGRILVSDPMEPLEYLLRDLCEMSTDDFWDKYRLFFVTCDIPRVRTLGGLDEWAPAD